MDETGVPLEPQPPKVVPRREKESLISNLWSKAANHSYWLWQSHMPPFIIFAAKWINPMWTKNEVSILSVIVAGWIMIFFLKHF